jgi:hypothetical protein
VVGLRVWLQRRLFRTRRSLTSPLLPKQRPVTATGLFPSGPRHGSALSNRTKRVAAAPRLLPGRNTQRRFNRHPSKPLGAPLFSHTPA